MARRGRLDLSEPHAKLQATGIDAAGRKQYPYHAAFRAQQEQAKFDRLIRSRSVYQDLRFSAGPGNGQPKRSTARACPRSQLGLINSGWFRVGTERYTRKSRTFGIATLRKKHVRVRGHSIKFEFPASTVRTSPFELASLLAN
jgi:DNA topoisomerase I